ncbi:MAG: T9SS type A sorting domain-containing protein [Flavobacteriales bacterium]|nr:T9SS type A sorting domain-containing protein [Flavobacteriales bacterium]
MKTLFTHLFAILFTCTSTWMHAQIENDNINVEIGVWEYGAAVTGGKTTDNVEPTLKLHGSFSDGQWISGCYAWNGCVLGNCLGQYNGYYSHGYAWQIPHNATLSFFIEGWENDDVTGCTYDDGDDAYIYASAVNQTSNNMVSNERWPCTWYSNWAGTDDGIHVGAVGVDFYTCKPIVTWRYSAGESTIAPLRFGQMSNNDSRFTYNATAVVDGVQTTASVYHDNGGNNPSNDVYYSFELTQSAQVSMNTVNSDFDTYLMLLDNDGNVITYNDDVDPGIDFTSQIETILCPGTYQIIVEGYQNHTGYFYLNLNTSPVESFSITGNVENASCPSSTDGIVAIYATGGVEPLSISWNNGETDPDIYNLGAGDYIATITDQCGDQASASFTVVSDDNTAPEVIVCPSFVDTLSSNTNLFVLTYAMINSQLEVTDNCGNASFSFPNEAFDVSDAGTTSVPIQISDDSGNSTTCIVQVEIIVTTGQVEMEDLKFEYYPNPAQDQLTVDIQTQNEGFTTLRIVDMTGRIVQTSTLQYGLNQIDISRLSSGWYTTQLHNGEKAYSFKLSKL